MLKLVANFKTSGGKNQTWSLPNPDTTNTPAELKGLLDQIGPLELFSKDGNNLHEHRRKCDVRGDQLQRFFFNR